MHGEIGNFNEVKIRKKSHIKILEMRNTVSKINSLYELSSRLNTRGN